MGRVFIEHLNCPSYACRCCGTQLSAFDALESKQFHSKNGPAWLFKSCVNVVPGPSEERLMTTGMHVVADISCALCLNVVGWKYEAAAEESQKYKEGKFILERIHVVELSQLSSGGHTGAGGSSSPPRNFLRPLSLQLGSSSGSHASESETWH